MTQDSLDSEERSCVVVLKSDSASSSSAEQDRITTKDIRSMEAAIVINAGAETLNVVKERAAAKRRENIEKATSPLWDGITQLTLETDELQADTLRKEIDEQLQKGAQVIDQASYVEYLHAREKLQAFKKISEDQAKEDQE